MGTARTMTFHRIILAHILLGILLAADAVTGGFVARADQRDEEGLLEVTIRPRFEQLKDGEVEDAVIATEAGGYILYSGFYLGKVDPRLRLPGSGLPGLDFAIVAALGGLEPLTGDPSLRRYGLDRDGVVFELGARFQGLDFRQIAYLYDVDLRPNGFSTSQGIYAEAPFNGPYIPGALLLPSINLAGGGPPAGDGPRYWRLSEVVLALAGDEGE